MMNKPRVAAAALHDDISSQLAGLSHTRGHDVLRHFSSCCDAGPLRRHDVSDIKSKET